MDTLPWSQEFSKSGRLTRYTAWLVPSGCSCQYHYGNKNHPCSVYPAWMVELTNAVAAAIGVSPCLLNSVNCNKYVSTTHDLYWHSDNEPQFRASELCRDTFIVSLSLGASRTFGIRRKQSLDPEDVIDILLENGDICIMLARMQCHFEHTIYGGVRATGNSSSSSSSSLGHTRYNMTWRFKQRHDRDCPSRN